MMEDISAGGAAAGESAVEYNTRMRRAFELWRERGCPAGQEVEIFREAETRLREEKATGREETPET